MKHNLLLILSLLVFSYLFGNPIDRATGKTVATNFLFSKLSKTQETKLNLKAAYTSIDDKGNNCFYVYNVDNSKGYVIVAADDVSKPILGYADSGSFDMENAPAQMKVWLTIYRNQIMQSIAKKASASAEIQAKWQSLLNPTSKNNKVIFGTSPSGKTAVTPLVKVFWNQSPQYNNLCPYDSVGKGRAVTGCVATAMAQVMKYWNYPTRGKGSNAYTPTKHTYEGVQTVNFDSTTYLWDSMPAYIGTTTSAAQIKAIATLMYSCGVAVNMNYGASGSSAYTLGGATYHSANWALVNYFGYNPKLQGLSRSSHSDGEWISLIENELNNGRPILYAGEDTSTSSGHCFVLDGYDENNYFHFNWGWGGLDNGYFLIDALNPGTNGIGSGSGKYNNYQAAIIGIQPASNTYNLTLYNYLTPTDTTIAYNSSIVVKTNVRNNGTASFKGDIGAAIYDTSANFVTFLQTLADTSIAAGSHFASNISFSNSGLSNLAPGSYNVQLLARPTGGDWVFVADNGKYHNIATLKVLNNTKGIILSDSIATSSFEQGNKATVSFNITNATTNTFIGQYNVGIYSLNGKLLQPIGSYTDTTGLLAGKSYPSPFVFSIDSLTLTPGNYIIAITDSSFSGSKSEYVGAGSFVNPIAINVLEPALKPDRFEPNNTVSQTYFLPLTFLNDTAYTNTSGANITANTLKDYFGVSLPNAYSYSISIELNNANYSSSDTSYSLDGLFAYSTNGTTWTTVKTNVRTISATGGKKVYFRVAPSLATYSGQIGTYNLELKVVRTSTLPIVFSAVKVNNAGSTNLINWQLNNQTNLDSYNVERSYNKKDFSVINTNKVSVLTANYGFIDNTFLRDNNIIFYRVAAIDKTGIKTYSNVVSVLLSNINTPIVIYPNPVKGLLNLQLTNTKASQGSIEILNEKGQIISILPITLMAGKNSLSIPANNLAKGFYTILVIDDYGRMIAQKQFIKE